jgi:hypothetical protein
MSWARASWATLLVFGAAQSCTNDFDKFEVDEPSVGGSSSGGSLSLPGTYAGTTSFAGRRPGVAGNPSGIGGAAAGESAGGSAAVSDAGAAGGGVVAGAGGAEPEPPCGGVCSLDHAATMCVDDECLIDECDASWGDCNLASADGCELPLGMDVANCGACERVCSSASVAALECGDGACASSCVPGFANCSQSETPDDGCETAVSADAANCGGCGNECPAGFVCQGGHCGCDVKNDCGNGNGVECVENSCQCDLTLCRPGERCRDAQGDKLCSCNGGATACLQNEVCCEAGGCTDVLSNAASCGACGHACTPGFVCEAGACQCDSVEDCGGTSQEDDGAGGAASEGEGGAAGTPAAVACVAGSCVCQGAMCSAGQRCLANGTCG